MIYNIRLHQTCVYDTAVEADSADEAVDLAKQACRNDPVNWASYGPIHLISVDPDFEDYVLDLEEDQLDEMIDEAMADLIADIYFGDDDEDDNSGALDLD